MRVGMIGGILVFGVLVAGVVVVGNLLSLVFSLN